ncbi:MAG: aldo/keto reductase [Chitinivibrionales bacterium]|nr:aldo/keto reductase [Chitinivibrionales bacterium]
METHRLGTTELCLTPVGLGCWAIGGGNWAYAWGPQDEADSVATIHRALEEGVNWIDTAPIYGLGTSESVVGKALRSVGVRPIIATKCGLVWNQRRKIKFCLTRESILREVDQSLQRLNVDVIDLYQIHWPNDERHLAEGWETLARLVEIGKIRYAGLSNCSVSQMESLHRIHPISSLQPPYSMLKRNAEHHLLPFCSAGRIGVIVYSPLQKGLLTGAIDARRVAGFAQDDHRKYDPLFQGRQLDINLELTAGLQKIAENAGRTVAQLAVAWTLANPEVSAAIVGARRPAQITETARAAAWKLSDDERGAVQSLLDKRNQALRESIS